MRGVVDTEDDSPLLQQLWVLLDQADVVVGQNSNRFDIKKMNARMIMNGFVPPRPYKKVDTFEIAKRVFGFTSNKLEWMTDKLNVTFKKLQHGAYPGFELWKAVMAEDEAAWNEMEEYNIHDVLSLEELHNKLRPWDNKEFAHNLWSGADTHTCTCGCTSHQFSGFTVTPAGRYELYTCEDCGRHTRGRTNLLSKERRVALHANVT